MILEWFTRLETHWWRWPRRLPRDLKGDRVCLGFVTVGMAPGGDPNEVLLTEIKRDVQVVKNVLRDK